MDASLWALVGLFVAVLVNRAADCWLAPVPLQCGLTRHPLRQGLVMVGVPVMFLLLALSGADPSDLVVASLGGAVFILLAVVDAEQRRLPNTVVIPALALAFVAAFQSDQLVQSIGGALIGLMLFGSFYLLGRIIFGPRALGIGDVKLAMLVGAVLGAAYAPAALLLAVFLAGAASLVLLALRRKQRRDTIPYGLYLSLAGVVTLLYAAGSASL